MIYRKWRKYVQPIFSENCTKHVRLKHTKNYEGHFGAILENKILVSDMEKI